jgi:urease alpha subunit
MVRLSPQQMLKWKLCIKVWQPMHYKQFYLQLNFQKHRKNILTQLLMQTGQKQSNKMHRPTGAIYLKKNRNSQKKNMQNNNMAKTLKK